MNHEWLKILVSVLAGMFAGIIADPIRESFAMRVKAYRVERAIRMDRINVALFEEELRETSTATQFWSIEFFPSFRYYWERNREYFYTDWRLQCLRTLIQAVEALEDGVRKGGMKTEVAGPKLLRTLKQIDELLDDKGANAWKRAKRRLLRIFS
jgi:hypothetical protein